MRQIIAGNQTDQQAKPQGDNTRGLDNTHGQVKMVTKTSWAVRQNMPWNAKTLNRPP